jgi:1-phosphofructokinase
MITTVSMNPCIDLTLFIDRFNQGASHRAKHCRQDVCGKAVNVAYALQNLDIPCRVLGFDFIENGQLLKDSLQQAGVDYNYVSVPGAIRTNTKIFEEEQQVMTEINQEGGTVPNNALETLLAKIEADAGEILVLSGSLPMGVSSGVYAEIIRHSKEKGKAVILDAYGEALRLGIEEGPAFIKPNRQELEQSFKVDLKSQEEQINFCHKLLGKYEKQGLRGICLSLGSDGAVMICHGKAYFAPALDIPVRGVQGAGDSMVAGLAIGLMKSETPEQMLKSAVALAAASLIREGTLMGRAEDFREMYDKVVII